MIPAEDLTRCTCAQLDRGETRLDKRLDKNLLDLMSTRYATRTWLVVNDTHSNYSLDSWNETGWENDICSWNGPTTRPNGISSSHHIETISIESIYSGFTETLSDLSIFSWQKQRNNTSIWFQQKIWLECQAPLDRGKNKVRVHTWAG